MASDEFDRLLDATAASNRKIRRLSGQDRAVLYLLAGATGFRAQELASLTPQSFDLRGEPSVYLTPEVAKNKTGMTEFLRDDVAEIMRSFINGKPADKRLWPGSWWTIAASILARDLATLGIEVDGPEGKLHFHSLRHTYVTRLVHTNAPVQFGDAVGSVVESVVVVAVWSCSAGGGAGGVGGASEGSFADRGQAWQHLIATPPARGESERGILG